MSNKEKVLTRATELLVHQFMKYGRLSCDQLKCKEKSTPSCIGKLKICEKGHISYFIHKAKEELK